MTKYRCISSFETDSGRKFYGAEIITFYEYITLPLKYQVKFQKLEELEFDSNLKDYDCEQPKN